MTTNDIATKLDILQLAEMLSRLERKLENMERPKPFLTGREVKELLHISEGKLQSLRVKGELKASKIQGTYFYTFADIEDMINRNRK